MAEKREQIEIGEMESRKTRMTWLGLDCPNPNPDRGTDPPIVRPINRDVIEYPFLFTRFTGKPIR
jgi:hypothetical protein